MNGTPHLAGLIVALCVLAVIFRLLERRFAARPERARSLREARLDIAYWFFTPYVTGTVTRLALALVLLAVALSQGRNLQALIAEASTRETWVRTWPWWVQFPVVLLLADLLAYGAHRAFHGRWLWRFHAIHHSSRRLDWLASARLHPLNDAAARVVQVLPLYFLGFSGTVLAGFVPLFTLYAIFLHANVRWGFGPLRYVIASPRFHRWHHTSEEEGLDTNFAGLFPFIDLAFGTFFMPADRQPTRFGLLHDDVPETLVGQLVYPFRRRGPGSAG